MECQVNIGKPFILFNVYETGLLSIIITSFKFLPNLFKSLINNPLSVLVQCCLNNLYEILLKGSNLSNKGFA